MPGSYGAGTYPWLVLLSVIVAANASFVALDLASMQEALLRVTMEALINIVKHAGARTAQVKLEARGDT
jgi:signal transduction histidine kinase